MLCQFCGKGHNIMEVEFNGVRVLSCPNVPDPRSMYAVGVSQLERAGISRHAVEVQTSVADYDGEDASDTDRPPPMTMRTCYFCGQPATDLVYNGMPSCAPCKQRAVGRRRRL